MTSIALRRLAAALLLTALAAAAAAQSALPGAVAEALHRAGLPEQSLAAIVLPPSGPAQFGPRWQYRADRPMQPASTMKLLTTVVALDQIGPAQRGTTELWSAAPRGGEQGEVLQGDLVLRGGADPELGLPQLWALLAELRWQGIAAIDGDIVLDRTLFRPPRGDIGQPPFDGEPEFAYNMIPDALQLAGNLMGLEIVADANAVQARALPPLPDLRLDASELRLTDRRCADWSLDWRSPPRLATDADGALRVVLQGGFPRQCSQRLELQLIDRDALAERVLRWLWQGLGGRWRGHIRDAGSPLPAPGPPQLLARHVSAPWGELLQRMNKRSDNVYARLLYLQLGVPAMADEPGTSTAGLAARAVQRWLLDHRIPIAGLVLDNGSGLSRSARITPRQLALALAAAQQGRWGPELMASLPLAGIDGTMRRRLQASPAGGSARLKSGSLKDVVSLAGFVADPQGRLWVVVAMINDERAASGVPALDALVDWVARGGMMLHWRLGAPVLDAARR